jgi:hypothetical protein
MAMSEGQVEYAVEQYGAREEVRELAERAKRFLPGGAKLTVDEACALAQVALAYNLNPFNGEVWYLKDEKTGRSAGVMVGIKGLRKAARAQSKPFGYQLGQRNMTPEERKDRKLTDDDVGRICLVYRTDTAVPGTLPVPFEGEGVARIGDRLPATKTPVWLADKRAEADSLRKAFDLPFGVEDDSGGNGHTVQVVGPVGPDSDKEGYVYPGPAELEELERAMLLGAVDCEPRRFAPAPSGKAAGDELFGD